ncbi:DUF998 domain-containing protein [Stenotrophomonas sp. 278]|uniref:DUF998 domain-containing protein n=1 Tax=Stenotrophomonas sp. 278 TaxID=2479851 RepID=UPI000F674881|nr:DUF998 domain-containing protein [Stenotrophomonas sp. 278]RRU21198.1 DUF998 domain-containing protein [Stenotrophomonas sp. 278]
MQTLQRYDPWAGAVGAGLFILAVIGFGAALPGYLPLGHPVALLGALGVPHALAFNVLGFVVPGLIAVAVALRLLARVPRTAPWSLRVGGQMLLLSGLAFAAMGLLPLDASDIESRASQYHASAWMVWVLAFVPGAVLSGLGERGLSAGRRLAAVHLAAGVLVGLGALVLQMVMPAPLAQRLAFVTWAVWLAVVLPVARR